jgi:hypothetical protein
VVRRVGVVREVRGWRYFISVYDLLCMASVCRLGVKAGGLACNLEVYGMRMGSDEK